MQGSGTVWFGPVWSGLVRVLSICRSSLASILPISRAIPKSIIYEAIPSLLPSSLPVRVPRILPSILRQALRLGQIPRPPQFPRANQVPRPKVQSLWKPGNWRVCGVYTELCESQWVFERMGPPKKVLGTLISGDSLPNPTLNQPEGSGQ
jgi:hypothetical protein